MSIRTTDTVIISTYIIDSYLVTIVPVLSEYIII